MANDRGKRNQRLKEKVTGSPPADRTVDTMQVDLPPWPQVHPQGGGQPHGGRAAATSDVQADVQFRSSLVLLVPTSTLGPFHSSPATLNPSPLLLLSFNPQVRWRPIPSGSCPDGPSCLGSGY